MTKKSMPSDGQILNWYLKHVAIPQWRSAGREQKDLADVAGVTPSAISNCAKNGTGIGMKSLRGIATAFGVSSPVFLQSALDWYAAGGYQPPPPEGSITRTVPPRRAAGERAAFEIARELGHSWDDVRRWSDAVAAYVNKGEDPDPDWWAEQIRYERSRDTRRVVVVQLIDPPPLVSAIGGALLPPRKAVRQALQAPTQWKGWDRVWPKILAMNVLMHDREFCAGLIGFSKTPTATARPRPLNSTTLKPLVDTFIAAYSDKDDEQWERWLAEGDELSGKAKEEQKSGHAITATEREHGEQKTDARATPKGRGGKRH